MSGGRKSALSRTSTPQESNSSSSSTMEDPYSASFDPASFKVVQLRALLHKHDIVLPSTARKAALIRAYEDDIRPRADEFRAAENRNRNIRPSGEGLAMLNPDGTVVFANGEREVLSESSGNELPSALSRPGTPSRGRRSVSWAEDVSGPEDDEQDQADASTFSINNPFQSPRGEAEGKPGAKKVGRKSEPAPTASSLSSQGKQPRLSTGTQLRNFMDPSIASSTPPRIVGAAKRLAGVGKVKEEEGDESGVEADLSRDAYDDPPSSPSSQKKKRNSRKASKLSHGQGLSDLEGEEVQKTRSIAWLFIATLTLSWWVWYSGESRVVGFCDLGGQSNALLDERQRLQVVTQRAIDDGDDKANVSLQMPNFLRPTCVPCPPHARCANGALLGCESSDYVLQRSFLSQLPLARKVVPLSMTAEGCLPDEQKVLLAADLADEIENRLRVWKGHVQCKRQAARREVKDLQSDEVYSLPTRELHQELQMEVSKGDSLPDQSEDYFEELWSLAMADLHATNRIGQSHRGQSSLFAKRGGVGIGLGCTTTLVVESAWQRMRFWLATIGVVLIGFQWIRLRMQSTRIRQGQVKDLVRATLSRLEEAKRNRSSSDEDGVLSISQLRDDILRNESVEAKKKKLWIAVGKVVEGNTNVRTRQAKVRGEWARVWEWIGTLDSGRAVKDEESSADTPLFNAGKTRKGSAVV